MAEAILRSLAEETFEACSAGTAPTRVHLLAVQVMSEAGYNITNQRAKRIHEFTGRSDISYVIDLCHSTRQACPSTWPELKKRLHWAIDNPEEQEVETLNQKVQLFRRCRDALMARIKSWLKEPGVLETLQQPVAINNEIASGDSPIPELG
jgi:arsenate reductase (thioredoxin)